jgi:hypothetical protein
MIKEKTALILLICLLVATSCATIFKSTKSRPEGFVTIDVFNGYGDVYFDDTKTEKFSTPIVKHKLPVGSHKIIINRDGFKPIEKTVQVKDDDVTFLSVVMEPILSKSKPHPVSTKKTTPLKSITPFYDKSLALVIGVDDYQYLPQLRNAFNDAQGMERLLTDLGFTVYTLYNQKATKNAIQNMISDKIANKASKDDRVLVFFAGHGQTRELSDGELGYIVPVEGKTSQYGTFISMTNLRDWCRLIPAKHLFFIMDSCYSGLGLVANHGQETGSETKAYSKEISKRKTRQITSGEPKKQRPSDDSPNGHSIFTDNLIRGIRNQTADLNGDGIITATELSGYIKDKVFSNSSQQQVPDFGPLTGRDSGEFVFKFPEDYLKGD